MNHRLNIIAYILSLCYELEEMEVQHDLREFNPQCGPMFYIVLMSLSKTLTLLRIPLLCP